MTESRDGTARSGVPAAKVAGLVADRVVITADLDPFFPLRALAAYSGLSVRKLRDCLEDPGHPLGCYRVGGKILVRRSEFDAWISAYHRRGSVDVDRIVSEILASL